MTSSNPVRADLLTMLAAVGLEPSTGKAALDRSFEELDLDSLARVELASRIKGRYGIDIEDEITPQRTPAEVEELIGARLATAA
ncbi:acyl carrier protein [Streptomyces sp. NPDC057638]|uniref:acyl carrier protein n=1 Tax=Streptomyces sp. NPDC057638 TaxID=3346190 RepID=UPI0036CA8C28